MLNLDVTQIVDFLTHRLIFETEALILPLVFFVVFFQYLYGDRVHSPDDNIAVSRGIRGSLAAAIQVPHPPTQEEEAEV